MKMLFIHTLLALTLLASCKKEEPMIDETPIEITTIDKTPDTVAYLALGDSYTIGQGVVEDARFPNQLISKLNADGIAHSELEIIATTGWRTDDLQQGIEDRDLQQTFNLVSLLIGVNNQYQGRDTSIYRDEFEALLNQAISFAGGDRNRVFVLSIPDYAYTPFAASMNREKISSEIDWYNKTNREVTESYGIKYYDITGISREGLNDPELIAGDNLHPSGKMYAQWVDLFYEDIKSLFVK